MRFHDVVRKVPIAEDVVRYAVRLAAASRPQQVETPQFINEWVSWGAGLRAAQYMVLGGRHAHCSTAAPTYPRATS